MKVFCDFNKKGEESPILIEEDKITKVIFLY